VLHGVLRARGEGAADLEAAVEARLAQRAAHDPGLRLAVVPGLRAGPPTRRVSRPTQRLGVSATDAPRPRGFGSGAEPSGAR
jgi:hypothetical protein